MIDIGPLPEIPGGDLNLNGGSLGDNISGLRNKIPGKDLKSLRERVPGKSLNLSGRSLRDRIPGKDLESLRDKIEIQQFAVIQGKVVDSNGEPLRKVKVTVTVSPGETKNDRTNKDGEYLFRFPATSIKDIQLDYSLDKYISKSITSVYQTSETKTKIIFDVPRITLILSPDPSQQLTSQVDLDLKKQINDILKQQFPIPNVAKLVDTFNNKRETIKNTLIPFAIALALEFGTTAAQSIVSKKLAEVDLCPSSATIKGLIERRNKLVKQLNNLYSSITTLNKASDTSGTLSKSLETGIQTAEAIPYPSIGIPILGLPPITVGVQNKASDALRILKESLKKTNLGITSITVTVGSIGVLLGTINQILGQLDNLLGQCAVDQDMDLEQLNNEINSLSNATVTATQSENNTYKGFALEVKINEKNTSKFIQRFAQASNKQGVPVLKTESSFASDPQVLIDQLKFIIDSNPNITAE
jgi:hypothetical protein